MTNGPTITTRARAASLALVLGLGASLGGAACSDEDGDGGTTDEEIQEGEDTVTSIADEIEEEVDAQDEGTNEDDE
jgi:hypothetical protein